MNKKLNKKAEINQVFVYLLSIMLVLFVGFLVTKFIYSFESDVDTKIETQIYSNLEKDYTSTYKTYGSEKVLKYKVTSEISEICFLSELCNIENITNLDENKKESLKIIFETGDNVALFSKDDIINSKDIGKFTASNGCFCINPNNSYFELIMENRKNIVYIFQDE